MIAFVQKVQRPQPPQLAEVVWAAPPTVRKNHAPAMPITRARLSSSTPSATHRVLRGCFCVWGRGAGVLGSSNSGGCLRLAPSRDPVARMSFRVGYGHHDDTFFLDLVEDYIWKPPNHTPPPRVVWSPNRVEHRGLLHGVNGMIDGGQELQTQAGPLCFVPGRGLSRFCRCLGMYVQQTTQGPANLLRIPALTSLQGRAPSRPCSAARTLPGSRLAVCSLRRAVSRAGRTSSHRARASGR